MEGKAGADGSFSEFQTVFSKYELSSEKNVWVC
jgi:hypothetical protein